MKFYDAGQKVPNYLPGNGHLFFLFKSPQKTRYLFLAESCCLLVKEPSPCCCPPLPNTELCLYLHLNFHACSLTCTPFFSTVLFQEKLNLCKSKQQSRKILPWFCFNYQMFPKRKTVKWYRNEQHSNKTKQKMFQCSKKRKIRQALI